MKKRNSIGWIIAGVIILLLVLFLVSLCSLDIPVTGNTAHIVVQGPLLTQGTSSLLSEYTTSTTVLEQLQEAHEDPFIKAIYLEINSPGGSGAAAFEVSMALERIDKPVVVYIRDVGASAAYWIASSADYIVATPLSIVGSVGVNGAYVELAGLLERYNMTYRSFTAGKWKDSINPLKPLGEEEADRFQEKIDLMHDVFVEAVTNNRDLAPEVVEEIKEADFYTGKQALELGLIDALGDSRLAIAYLEEQLNTSVELVSYQEAPSFLELLSTLTQDKSITLEVKQPQIFQ